MGCVFSRNSAIDAGITSPVTTSATVNPTSAPEFRPTTPVAQSGPLEGLKKRAPKDSRASRQSLSEQEQIAREHLDTIKDLPQQSYKELFGSELRAAKAESSKRRKRHSAQVLAKQEELAEQGVLLDAGDAARRRRSIESSRG
jgi:hypothetical protein